MIATVGSGRIRRDYSANNFTIFYKKLNGV